MNKSYIKRIFTALACCLLITPLYAEEAGVHRFANYNIRYVNASNGDTGEKLWANRRTYVVKNITGYDFDVVGMEEVTGNNKDATTGKSQLQDLRDMLTGYADYSVEREGKSYSYNSIFYKTSKYTLLEQGHFYVNEHPETPGIGWETDIARTCIWVHLQDKSSLQDFYFVCTHVNYGATYCGIESGKLIGNRIRQLVGQTPMVMVGDFNMSRSAHEEAYRGYASHFYDLALTTPLNQCLPADGPQITATTTGWTPATNGSTGNEFDYIWYDHMEPLSRHIITQYYPESGRTVNPSDHYPVLGRFRLGSTAHATRFHVTDVASLQTALANATMEDTIFLGAGNYELTASIKPTCSLVFCGEVYSEFSAQTSVPTLIASGLTEPVFNIPHYYNLELQHIHISGGNTTATNGGGAIYSFGPNLRLVDCRLENNKSLTTGGAVVHKGDSLTISGCVFSGNSAANGGAVWCQLRDKLCIHDSHFVHNTASSAGGAVKISAFTLADIQYSAFVDNDAATHGALDINPAASSLGAHLLNCSFIGNHLSAKKGLATATKKYGGAALWVDMTSSTVPINIGHCTIVGNHLSFNGTAANFTGAAVNIFQGKACLMNNLIVANELTIEGETPVWSDLYTSANDVNLWRNTYTLTSSSEDLSEWEQDITSLFGGSMDNGIYTPAAKADGTLPLYQTSLAGYNLACLPTTQRLCESAFTYDLNGDGVISGSVNYDQTRRARNVLSCIGAVEYHGESPLGTDVIGDGNDAAKNANRKVIRNHHVLILRDGNYYTLTGQLLN